MEKDLFIGKRIKDIDINGFGIFIVLGDGTELYYDASDGGYSYWEIKNEKGEVIDG